MPAYTSTRAVSPGYIYTVTASSEAIVRDVETDKLLCKANNGSQGMFVAIGGTVSLTSEDITATITQSSTTSGGARFEVHQTRPATGEEGVIYLIPITSGTDEDNEYEEWIWVKGEWERLGTTGVNLSNYATLTDANTYSGDNTFDGLLIKKNSASLGDTSVLNRSEADARYGQLNANNTWYGEQEIKGTLHLHNTLYVDHIQANNNNGISINDEVLVNGNLSMHPTGVLSVDTITTVSGTTLYINDELYVAGGIQTQSIGNTGGTLHINSDVVFNGNYDISVHEISAGNISCSTINLDTIGSFSSLDVDIAAQTLTISGTVNAKRDISIHKDAKLSTSRIVAANTTTKKIDFSEVAELQFLGANGGVISGVTALKSAAAGLNFSDSFGRTSLKNGNVELLLDDTYDRIIAGNENVPLEAQAISGIKTLKNVGIEVEFKPTLSPPVLTISNPTILEVAAISGVKTLDYGENNINLAYDANTIGIRNNLKFSEGGSILTIDGGIISGVSSLRRGNTKLYLDNNDAQLTANLKITDNHELYVSYITGVKALTNRRVVIYCDEDAANSYANSALLVSAQNGIKVTSGINTAPPVTIAPSKIEAFQLATATFGTDKYGLRLTSSSCQLFGIDFASNADGAIVIGDEVDTLRAQSVTIGMGATTKMQQSVTIGYQAEGGDSSVAIGAYAQVVDHSTAVGSGSNADGFLSIAIGNSAVASDSATALGCYTIAEPAGIAIGPECAATVGEINLSAGGENFNARCSMLLYGGVTYEDRDTTGYLKFEIGDTYYNYRDESYASKDTVTISKPNLWSALDRAKYRGAQPYASYAASAVNTIPALEPNSITHIYSATGAAIDLSDITLAQHDTSITTAELWIEVTTAGATITWPDDMLWPDEVDPTTAPSFPGPEASAEAGYTAQRLYCVTLRTQPVINVATGNADTPVLIATIAYTLDHKVSNVGS